MGATLFERCDDESVLVLGDEQLFYDPPAQSLVAVADNVLVPIAYDVAEIFDAKDRLWLQMTDGRIQQLTSTRGRLETAERQALPAELIAIASDGTEASWRYGAPAVIRNPSTGVSWQLDATWVGCLDDHVFSMTEQKDRTRQLQEHDLLGNRRWTYRTSGARSGRADHNTLPVLVGSEYALLNCGVDSAQIGEITCVRRMDGEVLWTKAVPMLCGIAVDEGTCAVAARDRFELWNAITGEELSSHELPGFYETIVALTKMQVVVIGRRGGFYVAERASPHAGAFGGLPGSFVTAIESGIFGPPGGFTVACFGPQQFGHYRRTGLLVGSGHILPAPELVSIPRIPWQRVKAADVEYRIPIGDMPRYDVMQAARVSVRETFYAVGREGRFEPQPTFDAEHGGLIVLEYSGSDARVLADLERIARLETVWADEMALRAGTGASFTVTARRA